MKRQKDKILFVGCCFIEEAKTREIMELKIENTKVCTISSSGKNCAMRMYRRAVKTSM